MYCQFCHRFASHPQPVQGFASAEACPNCAAQLKGKAVVIEGGRQFRDLIGGIAESCQLCHGAPQNYRVFSDVLDVRVCSRCAGRVPHSPGGIGTLTVEELQD